LIKNLYRFKNTVLRGSKTEQSEWVHLPFYSGILRTVNAYSEVLNWLVAKICVTLGTRSLYEMLRALRSRRV